jgi:hypothetical protein
MSRDENFPVFQGLSPSLSSGCYSYQTARRHISSFLKIRTESNVGELWHIDVTVCRRRFYCKREWFVRIYIINRADFVQSISSSSSSPVTPCGAQGIHEELPGIAISSYSHDRIPWSTCSSYFILCCPSPCSFQPTFFYIPEDCNLMLFSPLLLLENLIMSVYYHAHTSQFCMTHSGINVPNAARYPKWVLGSCFVTEILFAFFLFHTLPHV